MTTSNTGTSKELDDVKQMLESLLKQQAEVQAKAQADLVAQLKAQQDAQMKAQQEAQAALNAQKAALEEANKKLSESLTLANQRIDKLEKSPVPPATVVTPVAKQEQTEEPVLVPSVRWNRKTGEISMND
jgi:predicted nuclease with TOPRIM domain